MHSRAEQTHHHALADLTLQVHQGTVSRRALLTRAAALGLSLSASDLLFRTYRRGPRMRAAARSRSRSAAPRSPRWTTISPTPRQVARCASGGRRTRTTSIR